MALNWNEYLQSILTHGCTHAHSLSKETIQGTHSRTHSGLNQELTQELRTVTNARQDTFHWMRNLSMFACCFALDDELLHARQDSGACFNKHD